MKIILNIIFSLLGSFYIAYGQEENGLNYTKLTTKDGLSSSDVYTIYQDEKGKMWIGTANGLDVYDGVRFQNYNSIYPNILPASAVTGLIKDKEQNLWMVSQEEVGIFNPRLNTYRAAIIPKMKPQDNYTLWSDSKGNVFLTIEKTGVFKYDKKTNSFTDKNLPFTIPFSSGINSVFEDRQTGNYLMAYDSGVALYNYNKKELFYSGNNPDHNKLFEKNNLLNAENFIIDANGRYWIWTFRNKINLYSYEPWSKQFNNNTKYVAGIEEHPGVNFSFYEQKNGRLWMYGTSALFTINEKDKIFFNNKNNKSAENQISFNMVHQVAEDREENLWVATDNGLFVISHQLPIATAIAPPLNTHINVQAILQLSSGQILAGTIGNAILKLDSLHQWKELNGQKFQNENISENTWSLCEDKRSGTIWAGGDNGCISVLFPASARKIKICPHVFNNNNIKKICQDKQGHIWFGTDKGLIIKYIGEGEPLVQNFKPVENFNSIIETLFIDKAGLLWVGTSENGLYLIDPNSNAILQHYTKTAAAEKSLFTNMVNGIYQYNDSIYFVVSATLNILNAKTGIVKKITSNNGLPFNWIRCAVMDRNGLLWIATSDAMYMYNYEKGTFTKYASEEGFSKTNQLNYAGYQLKNGILVFGGRDNILIFDPGKIKAASVPPDVRVSLFQLFSTFLPVDSLLSLDQVKLNYTQNTFTIYFSSLSFSQRNNIAYYYMLKGIDHEWIKANSLAYCNYNSMPPGHYTLMLKAVNNEGVSSSNITTLAIYIKPPFWNTWWFSVLIGLLLAAIIYYIYRIRINRLLAIQAIRAKVARDLHDDVGSTLTTINILSEIAKTKTTGNGEETKVLIEKISDNSSRMMEAMGDIVWSINPANDSMKKIIARMREYAVTLLEAKNIEFSFSVDDTVEQLALNIEARLDFYLIFKETINNLVKYARSTEVSIAIIHEDKKLVMQVKDNGAGFDMDNYKKGNGLANMRKRAKNINAVIDIQSAPGKGTYVEVKMPII